MWRVSATRQHSGYPTGLVRRARRARCEAVNLVENFTWSTGGIMCMDTSTLVWKMCVCIYIINIYIYIHIQFGLFEVNWSFEETKTTSEFFSALAASEDDPLWTNVAHPRALPRQE